MSPAPTEPERTGLFSGYSHQHPPLGAYAALVAAFHTLFGGFLWITRVQRRPLPERVGLPDLLLFGVATHKLSRTITRDWVTSFIRAPFTRLEGKGDLPKEVTEAARGRGLRYAIGQLLTCPFCTGQWVAALFTYTLVLNPALARLIASMFTVMTLSDFLHAAWVIIGTKMEQAGTGQGDRDGQGAGEDAEQAEAGGGTRAARASSAGSLRNGRAG